MAMQEFYGFCGVHRARLGSKKTIHELVKVLGCWDTLEPGKPRTDRIPFHIEQRTQLVDRKWRWFLRHSSDKLRRVVVDRVRTVTSPSRSSRRTISESQRNSLLLKSCLIDFPRTGNEMSPFPAVFLSSSMIFPLQ